MAKNIKYVSRQQLICVKHGKEESFGHEPAWFSLASCETDGDQLLRLALAAASADADKADAILHLLSRLHKQC